MIMKHEFLRVRFGTLPIEIKFGSAIKQRQIQTLKNFVYNNNLPLGIVINNSVGMLHI